VPQDKKSRPAIAGAAVDAESGIEGVEDVDKALYALRVMRDRGLLPAEEYDRRRAALEKKRGA